MSLAKQNFANQSEEALNQQVNTELQASQVYLSMSAWAQHTSVALPGLEKYFREAAHEEREHAQKLIDYINTRGGRVVLRALQAPETDWKSAKNAVESALQLEKDVNKSLLNLHKIADSNGDPQMCDFIEAEYLGEQVEAIKKLADMVTQLNRVGEGLGVYLWDQQLYRDGTGAGSRATGNVKHDSLFEDEIVECPALLATLSEDARISYEQAKVFQQRYPPDSIPTDITMSQYVSIQEKGISAFEFELDTDSLSFVSARTEIQFFSGEGCLQTNLPLPRNQEVYYWEAKMFEKPVTTTVSVGVATKPYPSWRLPGWNKHSIGYFSDTGNKHFSNPFIGRPYSYGYEEGDVIGVGYRHRTGTIFFTRNGRKLDEACFGLRYNLFPTIGANGPCQIHVNLGQMGFVFVEANVKRWGLAPAQGTLAPPPAYGFEAGSFLLQRGGEMSSLEGVITPSSSRYDEEEDDDDDNTPLIQQRSNHYAAIPIPSQQHQQEGTPAPPSYSTFPRPSFFMDQAEYERNRRAGLI
ncbi:hypothetical protein G6F62_001464 [Rhizopus arrhizus]|uniref:Ferritin n=1 Tax=Rhizopus oryzae TaxID=64495 RepID=A0A9P7BWS6_RHIOR|nr:hypothetical protein G6F23_002791 [Rhizopus arrhizus]KAG0791973.1 hypothetical protein G6F21_004694 [Rhizopus arrhizus]KAG0801390.1 hypothetical protein G6F22_001297 [Rhizopus arrhizus]KAG0813245.1 hypothetical protein G6F20_005714 [Rhizopus arrhizus]KAG0834363.1 hypothetical protein G6F19_005235 [Rhizopus arrhizus]